MARVFRIRQIKVEPDNMCLIVNPNQHKGRYRIQFNPGCSKQFKVIHWVAQRMEEQRDKGEDVKGIRGDELLRAPYKIGGKECKNIYKNWEYNYKDKYDKKYDKKFLKLTSLFKILDKKDKIVDDIERCRKIVELLFHTTLGQAKPEKTYYWLGEEDTEIEVETKESEVPAQLKPCLIENVLDKEKKQFDSPVSFRSLGPMWIDFETNDGYVVKRDEVDKTIEVFQKKHVIAIKGKPASGKSVIMRNIGYKLAKQGDNVFFIEIKPKKILPEMKELLKLQKGYVFIDNAHLNLAYVDDVIQNLSNVKILVSTRDIGERFGPTYSLKIVERIKGATTIQACNAANAIIQKFSKRKQVPEETRRELKKNNLWVLAWQLMAYEESGKIDEHAVCKKVMHYMRKDLKELGVNSAENVFLPLSVFYKYEIPLRKEFISEFGAPSDIERLIELNEINEFEQDGFQYLAMHHSEIAEVFLNAFKKFKGLGNKIKKKLGGNWLEKLFHQYVENFSQEIAGVISKLSYCPHHEFRLIKNLVQENFHKVRQGIEAEERVGLITSCIGNIHEANKQLAGKLVRSLEPEKLKDKVQTRKNIRYIPSYIREIASLSKEVAQKLIPSVKNRVEAENDIGIIGDCIEQIAFEDKILARNLVKILDFQQLKNKTEAEGSVARIGWCIGKIALGSKEIAERLIPILKNKLDAEKDIEDIARCTQGVYWGNKQVAEKLLKSLDLEKLKNKIDAEDAIEKIGHCIEEIALQNKQIADKLVKSLNFGRLKNRIAKKDLGRIGWHIGSIAFASKEIAERLIPILKNKLDTEKDITRVAWCMKQTSFGNKQVAKKLLKSLDLEKLKNKIDGESDIHKIDLCIKHIDSTCKEVRSELRSLFSFRVSNNLQG